MKRVLAAIVLILLPAVVQAASGGGGHAGEHHGVPWMGLVFTTINFVLFIFILKKFAWPGVKTWVKDRREEVVGALQAAEKAKAEAEALKVEWEARLERLESEVEAIRAQARAESERERERILESARKAAAGIEADARKLAELEAREAAGRLRREVARQASAIAARLATQRLTGADQKRFVEEFLSKVSAS